MNYPIAVKKGIINENTDRLHNKAIVLLQEQDLVASGYNISDLPIEFNAEVLNAKEMRLRLTDLEL